MSAEKIIAELLPGGARSENKRLALASSIAVALADAGHLVGEFSTVEVSGGRVAVETVSVYGLDIDVDANGNAVRISSGWGLEIVE